MTYYEHPKLSDYYLEDSYVLDIFEEKDTLTFHLEAVISESHPNYSPPQKDQLYTYIKISIIFSEATSIKWQKKETKKFTDKSNGIDYGNIDSFVISENAYVLSGDWGKVTITGGTLEVIH